MSGIHLQLAVIQAAYPISPASLGRVEGLVGLIEQCPGQIESTLGGSTHGGADFLTLILALVEEVWQATGPADAQSDFAGPAGTGQGW